MASSLCTSSLYATREVSKPAAVASVAARSHTGASIVAMKPSRVAMSVRSAQRMSVGSTSACRGLINDDIYETFDRPLVGNKAPDFKAVSVYDGEFGEVSLEDYKGRYLVLFTYPLDFTFVCPTEITAFSDRQKEFDAIGCDILGVSVDSQFSHLAWTQMSRQEGGVGELNYPLVSDLKKEISVAYDALTDDGMALRGLWIIDKEGIIQHATINNLGFGRSVDETLRTLQAIQHVQNNPDEVCPAGWKPGDKTMNPTPAGSKDFFAAIE